jgi:chaperonin GroEL
MRLDRGYLSSYFVTDTVRMQAVLEDAYVLLHEGKITQMRELLPLLELVSRSRKPLLIIAGDVEGEALATLAVNKLRGSLRVAAIKAPGFGSRHKDTLADLAVLTGGTLLNAEGGRTLEKATLDDLGRAKRITVDKDHTILIGGGGAPDALEARIALLGIQLETTGTDFDRDALQERIAKLAGGVAIIRIGAATDIERNQRMACVEDALNATRAAQEEGIVPGGGVAYIRCIKGLYRLEAELGPEQQVGVALIRRALEEPLRRIAENGATKVAWSSAG